MRPTLPIRTRSQGYALVLALVFFGIFFAVSGAYLNFITASARSMRSDLENAQALFLAEAGIDKAVYELNHDAEYIGETGTALSPGAFTVTVSSIDGSSKQITATGYVPDGANPTASKTVSITVGTDTADISFRYGVQAGAGGFTLSGGSVVHGNIYANGNINATSGVRITGSATAANPPALFADQENDMPADIPSCTSSTCITFAKISTAQDVAQSFRISAPVGLASCQVFIKKIGNPSNAVVRIVNDNGGKPGTDTLLSGTLSASAVTTNFSWVTVTLPPTPVLDPAQTYWLVIDAASNASKYYLLGANDNGYAEGTAHIGRYGGTWSATDPAELDGYFKIYLGGGTSIIGGNTYTTGVYVGTTGSDDAWAHTIKGATVSGTPYCQEGSYTNKPCDTSRPDPTSQPMPLSDGVIAERKSEAEAGGILEGDYHSGWAGAIVGPKKITGDLLVDGGGTLVLTGTLWVEGSVTVTAGAKVKLAPEYGENDGVIIADGPIAINGGATFSGSGTDGSHPFLITTSACPAEAGCNGANAVTLTGGAGAVAIVAQNGNANINGGGELASITAKQITMSGGAELTYESGLINTNFSSGPGGSWTIVPGTYAISR